MQQYKFILLPAKVKHPIVSRPQFPDILDQMFRDILRQAGPIILQQLDIKRDLLVLDAGVFAGRTFHAQFF